MLNDLIHGHACSIDLQNILGDNPLLLASMHGRSKEALYLIEAGASINLSNRASLLDYLAIMRPEDIETITQALHHRGVRVRQAWCIGTDSMDKTYFFLEMIEGDVMLKAIGTNRLPKASKTASDTSPTVSKQRPNFTLQQFWNIC